MGVEQQRHLGKVDRLRQLGSETDTHRAGQAPLLPGYAPPAKHVRVNNDKHRVDPYHTTKRYCLTGEFPENYLQEHLESVR